MVVCTPFRRITFLSLWFLKVLHVINSFSFRVFSIMAKITELSAVD